MKANADRAIRLMLKHEGGFVNHPRDPGGATNRGITIGTLRRLGMDLDGDGDVDVADLKRLTEADAVKVYKRFYWDKVEGDLLPSGVDYVVGDFSVNSGPSRAAQHLQRAVGVTADGDIGPLTLAAVMKVDPVKLVDAICASRLRFMQGLKIWPTFKNGWSRRVAEVRAVAKGWAKEAATAPTPPSGGTGPQNPKTPPKSGKTGGMAGIVALVVALLGLLAAKFGFGG